MSKLNQLNLRGDRSCLALVAGLAVIVLLSVLTGSFAASAGAAKQDRKPAQPAKHYPTSEGLLSALDSTKRMNSKKTESSSSGLRGSTLVGSQAGAAAVGAGGVQEGPGLAGAIGSRTLVLYDTTTTFGFLGELYAMSAANLASHFGPWRAQPVAQYQPGQIGQYTATIYIGSTYDEPLPSAFLDDVYNATKPVIWVYDNIWALTNRYAGTFSGKYGWNWAQFDLSTVNEVRYKGQSLKRNGTLNQAGIMDYSSVDPTKATVLAQAVRADGTTFPWAVRSGNLTYVGENPFVYTGEKDRTMIFSDLLFDALDPAAGERHRALVRLEDIHPNYDPAVFKASVDYLNSAGVPFSFGVSPVYKDPFGVENNGQNVTVRLRDRQAQGLRDMIVYAQGKGGVLLYHGYTHQYESLRNPYNAVTGDDFEFYRAVENADHTLTFQGPVPADSRTWFLNRIDAGLAEFQAAGLAKPAIFEFPHYAGSHVDYTALLERYTTRYERALYFKGHLSGGAIDYGRVIGQMFPYVVKDVYGSVVIPENIGNYEPEPFHQYPIWLVSDLLEAADKNKVVRDGFASFYYHPFWGTGALKQIVEGLKARGYTFVSPLSLKDGDTLPPRRALAPRNTAPPVISGTPQQGLALTASTGSWDPAATSYAYQWQVCDAAWFGCVNAQGATGPSYAPQGGDVGHMVRVVVTAANAVGSGVATSAEVGPVQAGSGVAPQNTSLPSISGSLVQGQTLTLSDGSWSGTSPFSYNYQWLRCDASGASCSTLSGATAKTYLLTSADVGSTMRGWVSATNGYGSGFAESAATGVVSATGTGTAPQNTAPPVVSGTPQQGSTLTATTGSWSGSPTGYSYQWRRCDTTGAACTSVSGATSPSYLLTASDVGKTMRMAVTAANASGSATAVSSQTAVVTAAGEAPRNTSPPTISGTARVGNQLTASAGSWSGTQPIGYSYQWQRCNRRGQDCVAVASGQSYTLQNADRHTTIRVVVTATNAVGAATATSSPTAVVER